MKAIETKYRGYRFRSRLEAKWAVVFDNLNIRWLYEDEGFQFQDGSRYLPDFWLPLMDMFVEVKGGEIPDEDWRKIRVLSIASGKRVAVAKEVPSRAPNDDDRFRVMFPQGDCDYGYSLCRCVACGVFGIEYNGRSGRINCCGLGRETDRTGDAPEILRAYAAARAARFEHGESPVVASPMDLPPQLRTVTPDEWKRVLEVFAYYLGHVQRTG